LLTSKKRSNSLIAESNGTRRPTDPPAKSLLMSGNSFLIRKARVPSRPRDPRLCRSDRPRPEHHHDRTPGPRHNRDLGITLDPGQVLGFGFELPVDAPGAAGQLDEPVPFHRRLPGGGFLGPLDLLIDAVQRPPGPVVAVLVVDNLVTAAPAPPRRPRVGGKVPRRGALPRALP